MKDNYYFPYQLSQKHIPISQSTNNTQKKVFQHPIFIPDPPLSVQQMRVNGELAVLAQAEERPGAQEQRHRRVHEALRRHPETDE